MDVCVCASLSVCHTKQPHVLLTPAVRLQRARKPVRQLLQGRTSKVTGVDEEEKKFFSSARSAAKSLVLRDLELILE